MNAARSIQATIVKGFSSYKVTVVCRENGTARQLVSRDVSSRSEAECVARAFASQNDFPWH
jgi:hypothetical protein